MLTRGWGVAESALKLLERRVDLEHLTDGCDAISGVGASAITIKPTELVARQPAIRCEASTVMGC